MKSRRRHRCLLATAVVGLCLGACGRAVDEATVPPTVVNWPAFTDVSAAAGLDFQHLSGEPEQPFILDSMTGGGAFLDYDGDGWLDIFITDGTLHSDPPADATNRLYRNLAHGQADGSAQIRFQDVTAAAGLVHSGWGMGSATGDFDSDGDVDLHVTYWGPNVLYRNDGEGAFVDVTAPAGVGDARWGASATFGDPDADGDLDLYVANYLVFDIQDPPNDGKPCTGYKGLTTYCGPHGMEPQQDVFYRNDGDGHFTDVSEATSVAAYRLPGLGVLFLDADADGDQDLYVANDSEPNLLFRNDGHWNYTEVGAFAGVAYSQEGRAQAGMGVDAGDWDNDGDEDLFVTNFSDDVNTLYANRGNGTFADLTYAAGLGGAARPFLGWSTGFVDFNLDGWLDLFVATGHIYPQLETRPSGLTYSQRNLLYRNREGRYELMPGEHGPLGRRRVTRGTAFGDYDNDGDEDLLAFNLNGPVQLLRNDGGNRNSWIGFRLEGADSNRDGIGARVEIEAGGRRQVRQVRRSYGYLSAHDPRVQFGLGRSERVERARVRWPGGTVQVFEDLEARRYYVLREAGHLAVADPVAVRGAPVARTGGPVEERPGHEPGQSAGAFARALLAEAGSGRERGADPEQAESHYRRGVGLYRAARYEEALEAFAASIRARPADAKVWHSLGVTLYAGLGRYEDARVVVGRAVALDPSLAKTRELLGVVLVRLNHPREAAEALRQGVRIDPVSWQLRHRLGLAWLQAGELDSAAAALDMAVKLAPWVAMPRLHLARVYEEMGRSQDAAREREEFARLRPAEDQEQRYLQRLDANPKDLEARLRLGLVYFQQKRFEEARRSFEQVLAVDPGDPLAGHGLGALYHRVGRLDDAAAVYRRVLAADSTQVEVWNDLGRAYHQLGRLRQAEEAYLSAVRLRPDLSLVRVNLGELYADMGRRQDAVAAFEAALGIDPKQAAARRGLQRLAAASRRD